MLVSSNSELIFYESIQSCPNTETKSAVASAAPARELPTELAGSAIVFAVPVRVSLIALYIVIALLHFLLDSTRRKGTRSTTNA